MNRNSSVIATGYGLDDRMTWVRFSPGAGYFFFFPHHVQTGSGPTQSPVQWILEYISLVVKWPEREADNSPPYIAKVRMHGAIPPLPQYVFMSWCLVKQWDSFNF
jgi:hypothetical protein